VHHTTSPWNLSPTQTSEPSAGRISTKLKEKRSDIRAKQYNWSCNPDKIVKSKADSQITFRVSRFVNTSHTPQFQFVLAIRSIFSFPRPIIRAWLPKIVISRFWFVIDTAGAHLASADVSPLSVHIQRISYSAPILPISEAVSSIEEAGKNYILKFWYN